MNKFCVYGGMGLVFFLFAAFARADARTDFLINMLENGSNYRVRVQAATTLGKLRSKEAIPALVRALKDNHELVVISSATALGQIGDTSVIGEMEKAESSAPSEAAKSQLSATLRVLKALKPGGEATLARDTTPRFLIRIDAMGNSSSASGKELAEILRQIIVEVVSQQPGVVMQKEGLTNKQIKGQITKDKLVGYVLSGSVIRMEVVDGRLMAKVGLNVFTNPDYNLLMMPTAEGSVSIPSGTMTREETLAKQKKALETIADGLVRSIFHRLQQISSP